jgi:hypothetical protein
MLMGSTVLAVAWSSVEALTTALSWLLNIIEELYHIITRMVSTILDTVLNIGKGLVKIYFGQCNIIVCLLNWKMLQQRTVLVFALNVALVFRRINDLQRSIICLRRNMAIRTVQIILDSASSLAVALRKTLNWPPNIMNLRPILAILKRKSIITAVFVSHSTSVDRSFEVFSDFLANRGPLDDDGHRLINSVERLRNPPTIPVIPDSSGIE